MTNLEQNNWKNKSSSLNCYLKTLLVNKYIGKEIFINIKDKRTRYILTKEALEQFERDMIEKHGSLYNYQKWWVKENGFKNIHEYRNYLAKLKGLKNDYKYKDELYKKRGFLGIRDWLKKRHKELGLKNETEYHLKIARNKGFESIKDYQEHNAKENGFKSYKERRSKWNSKIYKNRKNGGRCPECGEENELEFILCEACRTAKRIQIKKRVERLLKKGLCRCGRKRDIKGFITCSACLNNAKNWRNKNK